LPQIQRSIQLRHSSSPLPRDGPIWVPVPWPVGRADARRVRLWRRMVPRRPARAPRRGRAGVARKLDAQGGFGAAELHFTRVGW